MMERVAKQYAQALFALALEEQLLDTMYEQLQFLNQQMEKEASFYTLMQHPKISKDEKKQVLDNVWKQQVHPYVLHLLKLLVDKRRFSYCKAIIQSFFTLYREEKNIVIAQVMSAKVLSEEELCKIQELLQHKYHKNIELVYTIQEELLAGVKLIVNEDVIDYSLQHRLQNLRKALHRNE